METIHPDEGLAKVHMLDTEASQGANKALTGGLILTAQQDHLAIGLSELVSNVGAGGDNSRITALAE